MSNEKRTGLGSVPAGLLRPTTRLDNKDKDREKDRSEIVEDETIETQVEASPVADLREFLDRQPIGKVVMVKLLRQNNLLIMPVVLEAAPNAR